jgi:hypothetical protein
VLITRRENVSKWQVSTHNSILHLPVPFVPLMSRALGSGQEFMIHLLHWERGLLWDGIFMGRFLEDHASSRIYLKHINDVSGAGAGAGAAAGAGAVVAAVVDRTAQHWTGRERAASVDGLADGWRTDTG